MNPIAYLFSLDFLHPILAAFIIAFPISCVFAVFLYWLAKKDKKKYFEYKNKIEKDTNPAYATWYRSYDYTQPKGSKAVILNEDNWVVVQWDRERNKIVVFTAPDHEDRKSVFSLIYINGKFEEAKKVNIEDLARIH